MTKTIVHAGFHKTGTTTLQQCFTTHRAWLELQGVHYPLEYCGEMCAQHALACRLSSARQTAGANDLFQPEREAFAKLIGARDLAPGNLAPLSPTECPWRLISSEIIGTFDDREIEALDAFAGPIDRFVLYVRNGVDFIYSCWATKVRWGYKGAFDAFLRASVNFETATPLIGPIGFVDMLIARFGPHRISVRSFDAAMRNMRGLAGDFLERELQLPDDYSFETNLVANASPSMFVTEVQRALNILAGPLQSGVAPPSHGVLRQALAGPHGQELQRAFSQSLQPVTKMIAIGDLRQSEITEDGSFRAYGEKARRMADWRFPNGETARWIESDQLLEALDRCPEFARFRETAHSE